MKSAVICLLSSFLSPLAQHNTDTTLTRCHHAAAVRSLFLSPFRPPFVHLQSHYTVHFPSLAPPLLDIALMFIQTALPLVEGAFDAIHLILSFDSLCSHLWLACLSVLGDRPVEPLSTRSRPRIFFPSRFHLPPSLPLIGRLFHSHSIYLIYIVEHGLSAGRSSSRQNAANCKAKEWCCNSIPGTARDVG